MTSGDYVCDVKTIPFDWPVATYALSFVQMEHYRTTVRFAIEPIVLNEILLMKNTTHSNLLKAP
jgi:hypothetical protein